MFRDNGGMGRIPDHAKKVFQGKIFAVWQWEQELYDGTTGIFEGLSRSAYGTVVGVLPDDSILLVYDEQPDRRGVLTSAGGRVEEGETAEEGATREFREETGYEIGTLVPFFTYKPSEKTDYFVHMFVGRDLTKIGEPALDPGERVELRTFSFEDFLRLGNSDSTDIGGPVRDWMLRMNLLEAQVDKSKRDKLQSLLYG